MAIKVVIIGAGFAGLRLARKLNNKAGFEVLLIDKFNYHQLDPVLKKAALWTYWKGAYRDLGKDEGATIVIQVQGKQGWFWYIPQHDDIVSVGVVE